MLQGDDIDGTCLLYTYGSWKCYWMDYMYLDPVLDDGIILIVFISLIWLNGYIRDTAGYLSWRDIYQVKDRSRVMLCSSFFIEFNVTRDQHNVLDELVKREEKRCTPITPMRCAHMCKMCEEDYNSPFILMFPLWLRWCEVGPHHTRLTRPSQCLGW
jgi:hypothetical protein